MASPVAVKISADFAEAARAAAEAADRSLTGQIEHWAKLGRAAEAILPTPMASALKRSTGDATALEDIAVREQALAAFTAFNALPAESKRARLGLDTRTRYEPDPENPNGLIRVMPDGTRTRGTVDGRVFTPSPV